MIEFFVRGEPRPRGSKTAMPVYIGQGPKKKLLLKDGRPVLRYVDSAKGSGKWMNTVADVANQHRPSSLWDCPVTMVCVFVYTMPASYCSKAKGKEGDPLPSAPTHKVTMPDVIKLGRAVEDALKGIIYVDDARIVSQQTIKTWSRKYNGVFVRLWPEALIIDVDEDIDAYIKQMETRKPF